MKKILLTAVVALCTLVASAQFMVVTTYDGDQTENIDKITANLGVGYMVNDAFTVGIARAGEVHDDHADHDHATEDHADEDEDDNYNLWVRYNLSAMEGAYAAFEMPTKDGSDNMKVGLGFSFSVWEGLHIDPSYTMPTKEDAAGKREGSFNIGIGYRF